VAKDPSSSDQVESFKKVGEEETDEHSLVIAIEKAIVMPNYLCHHLSAAVSVIIFVFPGDFSYHCCQYY